VFLCDQYFPYFCKMDTFSCQLRKNSAEFVQFEDCRCWASHFKICAILIMSTFNERRQFKLDDKRKKNGVRILLIESNLATLCLCEGPGFSSAYVMVFFVFTELRLKWWFVVVFILVELLITLFKFYFYNCCRDQSCRQSNKMTEFILYLLQ